MSLTRLMASRHPRRSGLRAGAGDRRTGSQPFLEHPVLPGEVPDALPEHCVLGSDPLRAAPRRMTQVNGTNELMTQIDDG